MMTHTDVVELADLYVLDALPSDVAEAVEAHLAECAACRAEIEHAWEIARLLRLAVPPVEPSPALRTRLMQTVNAEGARTPLRVVPAESAPEPRRQRVQSTGGLRWAAAAALIPLLLVGWLTFQVVTLQQQVRASELALERSWRNGRDAAEMLTKAVQGRGAMVQVQAGELAPSASGTFFYAQDEYQGVLVVDGLPQLPNDQVYQCWLMKGEERVSGGTLYRSEDGRGMLVVKAPMAIDSADGLRVTVEPRGGSSEPRGSPYLWARFRGT